MVVNENKTALAHAVRAEETVGLLGRLVTCRGIEHINKYLQDTGSQASLCWRKELQIWKEDKAGTVKWCQIVIGGIRVNTWYLISIGIYLDLDVYVHVCVCVCVYIDFLSFTSWFPNSSFL